MQAAPYVCMCVSPSPCPIRVLWTRPVSIFGGLSSPLINQDRRADRRETFVDSAKCQEPSIRADGAFTVSVGLDGVICSLFLGLNILVICNNQIWGAYLLESGGM